MAAESKEKQSQSKPILKRTNVNFCTTGYYESKPTFAVREGSPNNPNVELPLIKLVVTE